jgi:hypothetical protein
MPEVKIPFATQAYSLASLPVSAQVCQNFYAGKEPPDAKTTVAIFEVPGLLDFASCGSGPIRNFQVMNNALFVVSGPELYKFSTPGATPTLIGTGITGGNYVPMSNNGIQVIIVNGVNGWVWNDQTSTFGIITDPNFFPANTVTFFDEYFLFDKIGSDEWFFSNILDGTTYNALDFESASVEPSFVQAIVNQQENALIFKQRSIETWYDTGANDNPWARYDGATVERGCIAPLTPIKEDNSVFFLGDDLIFYRLDGVLPHRVSTHATEGKWQTYSTTSDAFCFSYTFNGHKFVVLTFPSANATWIFDIASSLWHTRVSFNSNYVSLGRWRGNCTTTWLGNVLIGDAFSNNIGVVSGSTYTEFGFPIIGELVSPPVHQDRKRIFCSLLELDVQSGVGLTTGQGSNPQIMLSISRDGGRTWGNFERWQSLGKQGQYLDRVRWKKLGQGRQLLFKVSVSDPVPRTIIAATANISVGQ